MRLKEILTIGVAAVGISSCEPAKPPLDQWNELYETYEFQLDPKTAKQMGETRGKLKASIGCYVDLAKQKIGCNVPKEKGPWRKASM